MTTTHPSLDKEAIFRDIQRSKKGRTLVYLKHKFGKTVLTALRALRDESRLYYDVHALVWRINAMSTRSEMEAVERRRLFRVIIGGKK